MSITRMSGDDLRRKARDNRLAIGKTTEADIRRQAKADGSSTSGLDFAALEREGGLRVIRPIDVSRIRAKTGLSQARFARAFQISAHTLRNWEQARRVPEGPARALLMAIDRDPETLMRVLQG